METSERTSASRRNRRRQSECHPGGGRDGQAQLAKVTIYPTDESLLPDFVEAAADALPSPPPATTLLIVKALAAPALLIEIEAIAARRV